MDHCAQRGATLHSDGEGTTVSVGRRGEQCAVDYLVGRGWRIVERNWYCRHSELDIIAEDPNEELVFVEVKYRRSVAHGSGTEAVTAAKLKRMRIAAATWLSEYSRGDSVIRFDVIDVGPDGVRAHLEGVE